jgi:glutaredoxin 3
MKVTIFSKDNCSFCSKAIKLAEEKQVDLQVKKLGADFTMDWMRTTFPTARTFPQIIIDGENIGGYTEFEAIINK